LLMKAVTEQSYDKTALAGWYKANKNTADHIMNDLKKLSFEGVMHIYAYTSKMLQLKNTVSQQDFPSLFTNNYTRVGDRLIGIKTMLLGEWNLSLKTGNLKETLKYWLVCGDLYSTMVGKALEKKEETRNVSDRNALDKIVKAFVDASIANGIKDRNDWRAYNWYLRSSISPAADSEKNKTQVEDVFGVDKDEMKAPASADFSHMVSYSQETARLKGNHKLYQFLIRDGVITDCDEDLLYNCMAHACFSPIWAKSKKNKLKALISVLKQHFGTAWYEKVVEDVGDTGKDFRQNEKDLRSFHITVDGAYGNYTYIENLKKLISRKGRNNSSTGR
jgi:hypothetical protein